MCVARLEREEERESLFFLAFSLSLSTTFAKNSLPGFGFPVVCLCEAQNWENDDERSPRLSRHNCGGLKSCLFEQERGED